MKITFTRNDLLERFKDLPLEQINFYEHLNFPFALVVQLHNQARKIVFEDLDGKILKVKWPDCSCEEGLAVVLAVVKTQRCPVCGEYFKIRKAPTACPAPASKPTAP